MKVKRNFNNQADWVRNLRKHLGLSQGEMGTMLNNITGQNVHNWEKGEAGIPESLFLQICCLPNRLGVKPTEANVSLNIQRLLAAKQLDLRATLLANLMEQAGAAVIGEVGSDELLLAIRRGLEG